MKRNVSSNLWHELRVGVKNSNRNIICLFCNLFTTKHELYLLFMGFPYAPATRLSFHVQHRAESRRKKKYYVCAAHACSNYYWDLWELYSFLFLLLFTINSVFCSTLIYIILSFYHAYYFYLLMKLLKACCSNFLFF